MLWWVSRFSWAIWRMGARSRSELRATYPAYFMAKNRVDLTPETDVDAILAKVEIYKNEEINDIDGVKIDFPRQVGASAQEQYRTDYSCL